MLYYLSSVAILQYTVSEIQMENKELSPECVILGSKKWVERITIDKVSAFGTRISMSAM